MRFFRLNQNYDCLPQFQEPARSSQADRALSVFYGSWNIAGVKQTQSFKFNHKRKLDGSYYTEQLLQLEK